MKKIFILTGSLFMMAMTNMAFCQSQEATPKDTVLENRRILIDSLDKRLFEILGARERVVREIGMYKAKNNIPPLQAARFQKVLEKGIAAGKMEGLSEEFCTELLNAIHKESLRIEEALK
jgi:chorismate mutase